MRHDFPGDHMTHIGVVHGRFQIFHFDHLAYTLTARSKCEHLIVGITNPDPTLTRADPADPHRSSPEANPVTYFERYSIIRAVLFDAGLKGTEFSIVPFPINFPELFRFYVPLDATFYLTIYDDWGRRKQGLFESLGLKVEVLWVRSLEEKRMSATSIRDLIFEGKPWEHLAPPATSSLMKTMGIVDRLRNLHCNARMDDYEQS